jgi:hypothetical protein
MYTHICTSMPAVYVCATWNTGMSLCVYVYACMYAYAYIYTHTYMCICMYVCARPWCWRARTSTIQRHACMHACICRCKYIYIQIFKRSKQMTFRQAKTLFKCAQTMCTWTHAHSIRSWRHGHMQTGERRQARHICAVCLVHSYVCFAYVRRNACNMHVYISTYLNPYIHVSVYVRMYVCIYVFICMYIRTKTQ